MTITETEYALFAVMHASPTESYWCVVASRRTVGLLAFYTAWKALRSLWRECRSKIARGANPALDGLFVGVMSAIFGGAVATTVILSADAVMEAKEVKDNPQFLVRAMRGGTEIESTGEFERGLTGALEEALKANPRACCCTSTATAASRTKARR